MSSTCATDNCSSTVSMENWREGDAPREYCEDCYQKDQEDDDREYTIEKQVVGMGYMSFYDEKDMLDQIVYCKNGCWKQKGDKTARDLDGDLCVTDDEEEEYQERDAVLDAVIRPLQKKIKEMLYNPNTKRGRAFALKNIEWAFEEE